MTKVYRVLYFSVQNTGLTLLLKQSVGHKEGHDRGVYNMFWGMEKLHLTRRLKGHARTASLFGMVLWIVAALGACSAEPKDAVKPDSKVPVTVAIVQQKSVPVQLRAVGTVEAYTTVTIKTLVGGEISTVHFREGQDVKRDDLLFTIDPRPFQAALDQAEANLRRDMAQVKQAEANLVRDKAQVNQAEANMARDMAQAKNADKDAQRFAYLLGKKDIAQEQYDQARANADALAATVRADKAAIESAQASMAADQAALENEQAAVRASQAAVDNARIQLSYCFIRSPMDGRTGSLLVQQGNVVKANDVPLVVIDQLKPIYVTFSVPERTLSEIKKDMAVQDLKVEAIIPGDEKNPDHGVLTFVDNSVDTTTGTIRLKGTFGNGETRLWPGQFVNTILTLTLEPDAIVVPSEAVQAGQQGSYVFVVKPDLTVESRPVTVTRRTNGETVIGQGLKPGETAVTQGQLRLFPGAKVEIKNEPGKAEERP
jgi:membrane fusion protein, multidrug efflux system